MSNINQVSGEKNYIIKMSSGSDGKIIEDSNTHTQGEIISRAEQVLSKELGQDLSTFAELEEVGTRSNVGDDTIYGYVNNAGKKVEFTEELKFKAAIAVLNLNGHFFEATPVN